MLLDYIQGPSFADRAGVLTMYQWAGVSPVSQRRMGKSHTQGQQQPGFIDFSVQAKGFKANKVNKESRGQSCGEFCPRILEVAGWGWGC